MSGRNEATSNLSGLFLKKRQQGTYAYYGIRASMPRDPLIKSRRESRRPLAATHQRLRALKHELGREKTAQNPAFDAYRDHHHA